MGAATSLLNTSSQKQHRPTPLPFYAMMGLSGAGKTAILYRLKLGLFISPCPSLSENIDTIDYHCSCSMDTNSNKDNHHTTSNNSSSNTRQFDLWDVTEGAGRALGEYEYWRSNYRECFRGIIFVVDSRDLDPLLMTLASERLRTILQEERQLCSEAGQPQPLLVLANKQDSPHAMTVAEVKDLLDLERLPEEQVWHIQGVSVMLDQGLSEGIEWLLDYSWPLVV